MINYHLYHSVLHLGVFLFSPSTCLLVNLHHHRHNLLRRPSTTTTTKTTVSYLRSPVPLLLPSLSSFFLLSASEKSPANEPFRPRTLTPSLPTDSLTPCFAAPPPLFLLPSASVKVASALFIVEPSNRTFKLL